jgi:glycerophosphoryl diester phosphodiesterase
MRVLSHRGLKSRAPGNSLEAMRLAAALGVDGIETDVRLSSEGEAILFHDAWTPDGLPIHAVSRRELSALVNYPVPSLAEALDEIDVRLWNIEIKTWTAWPEAWKTLKEHHRRLEFLVSSFDHLGMLRAMKTSPLGFAALVAHRPAEDDPAYFLDLGRRGVKAVVFEMGQLSDALAAALRGGGLDCWVYNANTRDDFQACVRQGVSAVISDFPETCLALRRGA